jgi:hypothetical protein
VCTVGEARVKSAEFPTGGTEIMARFRAVVSSTRAEPIRFRAATIAEMGGPRRVCARKGHHYATIVVNLRTHQVFTVTLP